jgi:peptidoglycan/xylan/chitin deacetylase (PgdA/CDA1 family)
MKKVILTIDDSPSKHMSKKLSFLKQHQLEAIFFCRGEFIQPFKHHVIEAIKSGFVIGNHSYSHPHFSTITLRECQDEIWRTEELINQCYLDARVVRPIKLIRLPFGDRGHNHSQKRVEAIQQFLKTEGFKAPSWETSGYIDAGWTWDTLDYKKYMVQNIDQYKSGLSAHWNSSKLTEEVILLHDFEHNQALFGVTMQFLLDKNTIAKA